MVEARCGARPGLVPPLAEVGSTSAAKATALEDAPVLLSLLAPPPGTPTGRAPRGRGRLPPPLPDDGRRARGLGAGALAIVENLLDRKNVNKGHTAGRAASRIAAYRATPDLGWHLPLPLDSATFALVYSRRWRGVLGAACRVLGRVADAEDVTQEVFVPHGARRGGSTRGAESSAPICG